MTDDAVRVRGLRFSYGGFTAVDGVDLSVAEGELFALLGTNGAGKTTTLEVIEGHRRAQSGQVRVLGLEPYRNRRRLAGDASAMLQSSGFAGDLTVAETLRLWRSLHADRRPEQAVPAPLTDVELDHRADVRVKQLSGGERRRLDLAIAISTDPRLLLLDEPTTGMDPAARERTWELLRGLLSRGRSLLLTTHYLEEAEALADRVAIMHEGRIAVSGTVAEIASSRPATIRCVLPDPTASLGVGLPGLAGTVMTNGREVTVRTTALQADLHRLLSWADDHGLTLNRLRATEATLAEVFHEIQAGAAPADLGVDAPGDRAGRETRPEQEVVR